MEGWVQEVILKWTSEGVKLAPPTTLFYIEQAERTIGFKFPDDFKEFYLQANGFIDFDMQEHLFTLWSIESIIDDVSFREDKDYIGFGDYLINSSGIGYSKVWPGVFKDYEHFHDKAIVRSFRDVLDVINFDPGRAF